MIRLVLAILFAAGVAWGEGSFTFTITADSHLDNHTDLAWYQRTLRNAAADGPAFHVVLGNTFMTEKSINRAAAAQQYLDQRRYVDLLRVPLYLVSGNHDGESGEETVIVFTSFRSTRMPSSRARRQCPTPGHTAGFPRRPTAELYRTPTKPPAAPAGHRQRAEPISKTAEGRLPA